MCGADRSSFLLGCRVGGSSPRVRSRHWSSWFGLASVGIISACAEQTPVSFTADHLEWDHLRVCGADFRVFSVLFKVKGSSPRVRSRPAQTHPQGARGGIISACAEQTTTVRRLSSVFGDHLRVCGADAIILAGLGVGAGSSPRVRSRRTGPIPEIDQLGIISACAEQTPIRNGACERVRDHLRVCGADRISQARKWQQSGSSPRVRSRRCEQSAPSLLAGIISACAEQTRSRRRPPRSSRDHLRVCGADDQLAQQYGQFLGSSPRVRSRPPIETRCRLRSGIISACAEQTAWRSPASSARSDHLRVCGADGSVESTSVSTLGSSPRVRSRPASTQAYADQTGIISACAEQTQREHG